MLFAHWFIQGQHINFLPSKDNRPARIGELCQHIRLGTWSYLYLSSAGTMITQLYPNPGTYLWNNLAEPPRNPTQQPFWIFLNLLAHHDRRSVQASVALHNDNGCTKAEADNPDFRSTAAKVPKMKGTGEAGDAKMPQASCACMGSCRRQHHSGSGHTTSKPLHQHSTTACALPAKQIWPLLHQAQLSQKLR